MDRSDGRHEQWRGMIVTGYRIAMVMAAGLLGLAISGCVDEGPRMHRGPGPVIYSQSHHRTNWDSRNHRPASNDRWDRNDRNGHVGRGDRDSRWDSRNKRPPSNKWDRNDRKDHVARGDRDSRWDSRNKRSDKKVENCRPTKWQSCDRKHP